MPVLDLDKWLKPEDVEPEAILVFTDEGKAGEIPAKGKEEATPTFEIGVKIPTGEKRLWTMNKTSQRAVSAAYGLDTKNWVNKQVVAFVQERDVRGTMKKVIFARIPEKVTQAPPPGFTVPKPGA